MKEFTMRSVGVRSVGRQFLRDIGVPGAPLEQHVLQQMGHAALARAFLPRPHQVGDVHCRRRFGGIGKNQNAQPVGEFVFGNPLNRRDFFHSLRQILGGNRKGQTNRKRKLLHAGIIDGRVKKRSRRF
jgi:hypothetical protein